ncbi:PH (Pleckstrin Homology) domain-containing protein [Leucobacter luti]|uniref:PH (Pleckstrin Homology) domain-containing protein n=1 Tax=Leucobacter luti TaxID=340320 RepID=A0A4R6RRZ6_9MICO|nr:PH domain-containing protein [Leucobacter luti]TDP89560.1 PH (Pleckstrin Homology) domain-containing protein [Leucobacter luti]
MSFAAMPTGQTPQQPSPSQSISSRVVPPGAETVLWSGRTHWKILAGPALVQLVLIAVHVALAMFWPSSTGVTWVDAWGQLAVHSIVLMLEIWYVVVPVMRWTHSTFTVTSRRVTRRWGVLYKHSREIPVDRIVSVAVERGIIDRLFGCGTLVFHDAAAGMQPQTHGAWNKGNIGEQTAGVRFHDVPHVFKVQKLVDQTRYGDAAHY